ncbi:MAG: hypothetical protein PQJ61_10415 [Spirochaetales bacterium]|uniref:V-type ATP synthase subunit I n=1 Tax=Candidatus Thalassospirochaeta sargassi TaxID=3119039 RepID=A0AAJ1MK17_9SPIO|nr:hypothetical protein [Spirochaetales bacterium]
MAIVKMKKVSLVLYDKYREESLNQLRDIGVVHLEPLEGCGEQYEKLFADIERLKNAAGLLQPDKKAVMAEYEGVESANERAEEILSASDEIKTKTDRYNSLSKEIERIAPLGNFEPELVANLQDKDFPVTVFSINKADAEVFKNTGAFLVSETKSRMYYACVADIPEGTENFEIFQMPEASLESMNREQQEITESISNLEVKMSELSVYKTMLLTAADEISGELEFEIVRSGINVDEKLSYLNGYCPVPVLENLKKAASENGWGLMISDPAEEDAVPTQLKLGKVASLLTPVTDFLGILPGYREYDISFFFLCFFSVFTAMLIGDAGYGTLFLALTVIGMLSFGVKRKGIPKAFFLLLILSVTTIIYGAISGTWFASKSIMEISFFQSLKLDVFNGTDEQQIALVMGISFFLGIVQLLIGVVQNFRKNFPKLSSFAQIGWFAVLVAIYYLVLTLVVRREGLDTYPSEMLYVLLGGVLIIFLFGAQEEGKSFIKGIIASLSNFLQLFLDVVGTFSDIMSYVRLFAVGLASVKIAETFNQLGAGMSDGPIIIFGIIIVILGHSINIVLGLMAILVHAVRLNILEYSGKVGVEWSGFKYEPFKK